MKKQTVVLLLLVSVILMGVGCSKQVENPTISVKPNIKVEATSVNVAKFYDGKDGLSLSIPSGNRSTCVWTWAAGSGHIPYSVTTNAETATEKHTITVYGDEEDLKVSCFDDFGNQYVGIFPSN